MQGGGKQVEPEFLDFIKQTRNGFSDDMYDTWMSLSVNERVSIENLLIAYDQMADRIQSPSTHSSSEMVDEVIEIINENISRLKISSSIFDSIEQTRFPNSFNPIISKLEDLINQIRAINK